MVPGAVPSEQPDPLAPYQEFLQYVHAHIVRLGVREHLIVARLIEATAQWPPAARRDAVASALARTPEELADLRAAFDRLWPSDAASTQPTQYKTARSNAGLRWLRVLRSRWRLVAALLLGSLCLAVSATVAWRLLHRPPPVVQTEPMKIKPRPDSRYVRQVIPQDSAPKKQTIYERPPLVSDRSRVWTGAGALAMVLAALALFLLRLGPFVRTQLERRRKELADALATQRTEAEEQRERGEAERHRLTVRAVEKGDPVRTEYHIRLGPPLPAQIVEDTAVLLGRVFQRVKGRDLDVPETVRETIQAGGEVRPVFLPQRRARELVVLYHEGETRPYLPGFLALVRKWQRLGVRMTLYPFERHPGELRGTGRRKRTVKLEQLAQLHEGGALVLFASHLAVKDTEMLSWPSQLRAFALRAWLDPDPRRVEKRDREAQASIRHLDRLLVRFPLTGPGLQTLARFLGAEGVGVKRPAWDALLPASQLTGGRREALTTWIALAALVPDAHWLQFEGLRQELLAEELPDPRAIRWALDELSARLGEPVLGSGDGVELPPALRQELLDWLSEQRPELVERAGALLKAWLGPLPEGTQGDKALGQWDLVWRHAWYDALQSRDRMHEILKPLLGGPMHSRAAECLALLEGTAGTPSQPPPDALPPPRWRELRLGRLAWQSVALAAAPALLTALLWRSAPGVPALAAALGPGPQPVEVTIPRTPYERVLKLESFGETEARPALVQIPAGKFVMGSPKDEPDRVKDEELHEVEVTQPFLMMETEVTQGQYQAVMGDNPSEFAKRDDWQKRPVEKVSWLDAVKYSNKLSEREGLERCYEGTGDQVEWRKKQECKGYRLPTEAEWEYAARAGQKHRYAGSDNVDEVAWYSANADEQTHPVKDPAKKPNAWGLHGMSGNVFEWVWDWHALYKSEDKKDPVGPLLDGSLRVYRGGSWGDDARWARVADRSGYPPGFRFSNVGFRLSRSYP